MNFNDCCDIYPEDTYDENEHKINYIKTKLNELNIHFYFTKFVICRHVGVMPTDYKLSRKKFFVRRTNT